MTRDWPAGLRARAAQIETRKTVLGLKTGRGVAEAQRQHGAHVVRGQARAFPEGHVLIPHHVALATAEGELLLPAGAWLRLRSLLAETPEAVAPGGGGGGGGEGGRGLLRLRRQLALGELTELQRGGLQASKAEFASKRGVNTRTAYTFHVPDDCDTIILG